MDNQTFFKNGYIVTELFIKEELDSFVETLKGILIMQCKKMKLDSDGSISELSYRVQKKYPKVLDESFQILRNTSEGHKLSSNTSLKHISNTLLGNEQDNFLIISGPSFFINFPNENGRKYTYHSEQNWYPKRRNFINVWCPIIEDRVSNNSMELKVGSHNKDWFHFSEYSGYDGNFDQNANIQYEIPDNLLLEYTTDIPDVKIGEAIFFDGKTVHRSLDNLSQKPYFTIVFRAFDYSKDLTLSSNWADLPYNKLSMGYPNINI